MEFMTHNSWTFMKPRTFAMKLINFTAQCQEVDIQTQYEKYNVRIFDLRIRLNNGKPVIAHGLVEYKNSPAQIEKDLAYLNSKANTYCRVFLEIRTAVGDTQKQRDWFINYCKHLEDTYNNIKFCGGYPTYNTGIQYYKFKYSLPRTIGAHASWATKNKLDDLYPRGYAKKHNKESVIKFFQEGNPDTYLSLDFVNIR